MIFDTEPPAVDNLWGGERRVWDGTEVKGRLGL
jgi:hypothetical protein